MVESEGALGEHRSAYIYNIRQYRETPVPDEIVPSGRIGMTAVDDDGYISIKVFHGVPHSKASNYWWEWQFKDGEVIDDMHHERDVSTGDNNITPLDLIAVYQAYEWFTNRPEGAYHQGETTND